MSLESISSMQNSAESILCIDVLDKSKKDSGKRTNTYFALVDCVKGIHNVIDVNNKLKNTLLSVNASKKENGGYVVCGSYTSKLKSSTAEGLFIAEIEEGKVTFVQYNGFSEFKEFLSYLPDRQKDRVEKKKEKREKSGKSVAFNMLTIHHPMLMIDDAYFILAEYYHPTYRQVTQTTNGQTTSHQVFDGYRYTHASLVKYDLEGKMLWDRTFELSPAYKPFFPVRFISLAKKQSSEAVTMVYCSLKRIVSKSIRYNGEIEFENISEEIDSGIAGDKTKRSIADVDYWYDNYFMIHGSEVIKNNSGEEKRKRYVYFVSKLRF
jgi:hypothetical protein